MSDDKFAKLKAIAAGEAAAASSLPELWKHEVGKPLIGTIQGFGQFENDYGIQNTVIVKRESGECVSAILTPYLNNGIQMQHAEEGDLILIQLLGKEKGEKGKVFNKFTLVVEKD